MIGPSGRKGSSTDQVSLFEKVPEDKKLGWTGVAAILSGVVSSLTKLMGGGIVAYYAGCVYGLGAAAIMFVLSVFLTFFVGRISFREGLPSNVTSRFDLCQDFGHFCLRFYAAKGSTSQAFKVLSKNASITSAGTR